MGEAQTDDVIDFDDPSYREKMAALVGGDFPLAHSLRRRKRERDHPEPVIAGHDSVI
jgi:hypothetical protein